MAFGWPRPGTATPIAPAYAAAAQLGSDTSIASVKQHETNHWMQRKRHTQGARRIFFQLEANKVLRVSPSKEAQLAIASRLRTCGPSCCKWCLPHTCTRTRRMTACEWVFMRIKNLRIKTRSLPTTPWPGCAQPIGSKISTEQVGLHFEREHCPNRLLKARVDMCQFLFQAKFTHFRFKDDLKVCLKKNFFDFAFSVLTRPYNFWRVLWDWISASFLLYPRFWSLSRKKASCYPKASWFPWQVRKRRCVSPEIKALKTSSGWQEVLGMYTYAFCAFLYAWKLRNSSDNVLSKSRNG